ncbi:dystrophin isoform X2 [Nematostella vectensis]|uniref:dystrophin isoform X2 n=1 Tax=Nematostella vectensis TaxID=45351 RepID=UPI0020777B2E|nr:dystrophin isoform X2 [Nematostella vectensis]
MDPMEEDESGTFTLKIKSRSDEHEGTQKKTFTKWINIQLSRAGNNVRVGDLFNDLKDGTILIALLEVLTGKKIKRERGNMRLHHLNNVNNAMMILEENDIRLINISNNDIVDGNHKMTLGLIWSVIAHFQLNFALQFLMDEEGTPEEVLLSWCQNTTKGYKGVSVTNFTTSWRDGLAFNAVIHRYRPDLFSYDALVGSSPMSNCEHAFKVARDSLGVDSLLDAEDVVRDRPDKKSIIMYVTMLCHKLSPLKMGADNGGHGVTVTRNGRVTQQTTTMEMTTRQSSTVKRTINTSYSSDGQKYVKTSHEEHDGEPVRYVTTATTIVKEPPTSSERPSSTVVERILEKRPDSFILETGSVRDSVGSFSESNRDSMADRDWEDYNAQLQEVLTWLREAETKLSNQADISTDVDVVKDQFHDHEDFMMELTSHQASVGGVLEFGNQLISEGVVTEKEENEIRDQMISLNERWESLRITSMERQTSLHEQLMSLQQRQIDQLAEWLDKAEKIIDGAEELGSDMEAVRQQVEQHKKFQENLEQQQQKVNSLTHMVVVVEDNAAENVTADLEEQLAVLGERWSGVCRWTEMRWSILQEVLSNWQEYRDEEKRLAAWLMEKEREIEDLKTVDLSSLDDVRTNLEQLVALEQEMEAQQATFGTFNLAAERVAEHLDEDSDAVMNIQDRMEDFNDQWNKITTDTANRITLLKAIEPRLQHAKSDMDEKVQWITDTETLLLSPNVNFNEDAMSSEELHSQLSLIESLESTRKHRAPSVTALQKKCEEIKEHCGANKTAPIAMERDLKVFLEKWEHVAKLITDERAKASMAKQRRDVLDISGKIESVLKDVERFIDRMGEVPANDYEIKVQQDQCKSKLDEMNANEYNLTKMKDLSKGLSKDDKHAPALQATVKRQDERWTSMRSALEERKRELTVILESGPPKQYLNTMDSVLLTIKNIESVLSVEFLIGELKTLEEQMTKYKQLQSNMQDQKKNLDYLNTSGDKFMKTLPRQKLEQLRTKLNDLNNKWKDISVLAEKRQTQVHKAINQNKQFSEEIKGLHKWIREVNGFLKDQVPAAGDPETLEAQLDQSEALQGDISKLQRKLDSLNETGTYMLSKAESTYASRLRDQLDDVTVRWDALVRLAGRVKDNLMAALEKYQKVSHDMKEMSHWIIQTERSIADDDRDIASGEITNEKMDHYKDLQQDISKRAPVVVRINTTVNQLVDKTKQGSSGTLVENLKKLNSDWARLKNKVAQRQHEFKLTKSEMEQFNVAIKHDYQQMSEIDRVTERCYDSLKGSETDIEDALRNLNRLLTGLKTTGSGSVQDVAAGLINKNIAAAVVRRQRDEYVERLNSMSARVDRTKQVLNGELSKRQQLKKDFEVIRIWITKIEVLISSKLTSTETLDERELKSLTEEFSSNKELLASIEKTCRELDQATQGTNYAKLLRDLEHFKTKWETVHTKFAHVRDQPMKKLGSEFETVTGELLTQLDKISRGVRKIKLVSGDPRDIQSLIEQCSSYRAELANIKKDVEQVKKIGQQIIEKSPEEKKSGVERRVEEVEHEHVELEKKVQKKVENFTEALKLSERLENDMTKLETWLEETKTEAKRRADVGFPDDIDNDIKWNKSIIKEVTSRLSEVQRLTELGRELVDLSETGQLESLEDRLTRINNTWEELSSLLEHRLTLLPKYKTQLKDFEKLVDQLNSWLDKMNKEADAVDMSRPDEARERIQLLQEDVDKHESQFQIVQQKTNEFVCHGRPIMEPYRRLLDRRWDELTGKMDDLEEELEHVKQGKGAAVETEQAEKRPSIVKWCNEKVTVRERKVVKQGGVTEEVLTTSEHVISETGVPMLEETLTTRRTYSFDPEDDVDDRLNAIFAEIEDLERLLREIENPRKEGVDSHEVTPRIKQAEDRLDKLQPRVESILHESKSSSGRETPKSMRRRQSLLDLSGRWLKACDAVDKNKRAIKVVPNWYQFTSNIDDMNAWLKKLEDSGRDNNPELLAKDLRPGELEDRRAKYDMICGELDKLEREGVEIMSPQEISRLRVRLREILYRLEVYKKPPGDVASYRIVVHTNDVKDADTRAHVSCVLYGDRGKTSPEIKLSQSETYNVPFGRDQLDVFQANDLPHVGDLGKIKIWHDNSGPKPAWNVKSIYVEDRLTGKVYCFDCNKWVGRDRPGESRDVKCVGFTVPKNGEDIMTKHRLAHVRWKTTLVTGAPADTVWPVVEEITRLSDDVRVIEKLLSSSELQGADYEDFSSQEDKLKVIAEKLEELETKASDVFNRSENLTPDKCSEKEYDAVKRAASKLRLDWNTVNKDYKTRMVRWEKAQTVWRAFHCDLKDLTSWLNRVERVLADTKMPSGDLNVDAAMAEQRSMEDGIATHQGTVTNVNTMGEEIISQSNAIEAKLLRDKLGALSRRWKDVCSEVADRRDRFKEEEMQIQEFMEESGELLQWMDDTEAVLKTKDLSAADEDALEELLDKVKEVEREIEAKDDTVKTTKATGERLLTKTVFSKPNHDMVRTRLDLVLARWEILRMDGLTRKRALDSKLSKLNQFMNELEELSLWASTTRDMVETQANLIEAGSADQTVVDVKSVQESLKDRQRTRDNLNDAMSAFRRESKLESTQIPRSLEDKFKQLTEDWARISLLLTRLFTAKTRTPVKEQVQVAAAPRAEAPRVEAAVDGWTEEDRSSPWPKFDKAVSELHIWLDDVSDMMKAEKVVLGDSDDMFALAEKQKSVDEQLKAKQHLRDEIAEMGHSLSEDAEKYEDRLIISNKVDKLKKHWEKVQDKSTVWRGQIDYLMEEWKRYVELREELVEWLRKSEEYLGKDDNAYNYNVSELEEQMVKHKEFEEDVELWRGSITAVTHCGENLCREFPHYESAELKHNLADMKNRWDSACHKSEARREHLKEAYERMVQFHEEMIHALTWLTTAESKVAELDSAVDTTEAEDRDALKAEIKNLEEDINNHQEMFASLNENGHHIMTEMEPGDTLTAVQSKLDDMNDRWQSLNVRTIDIRDRLEETATEWRQLLMDLQEILEWISRADEEITSQQPIGGDLEAAQNQNEQHQAFKGKVNVRRLVVDRALDSGRRFMDDYRAERTADTEDTTPRGRVAGNLQHQLEVVSDRWSALCQRSEEWQKQVDEALRRFQLLQSQMEEIDARLTEAEVARAGWTPVQDLVIESLNEQMEELKLLQDRIAALQHMFEQMSNTEGDLRRRGINISANLQNRIDQLYRRWKQLQLQMIQRQNALQDAYADVDTGSIQALAASVDPPWERAVAVNQVPYYINHKTETTQWDHPKMTELYHQIAELNDIKYSAYRTAMKLRCIQKATKLDLVTLNNLSSAFVQHNLSKARNDALIGVAEMVDTLHTVFDNIEVGFDNVNPAINIDLTLNWLLNVYDSGRVGKIRLLSFKIGLVCLCRAHLDDKYNYLFKLVADNDGKMDHKQLGLLLHDSLQVPRQLGEIAAFGGSNIEPSVRSCFEKAREKERIDPTQFVYWLSAEPQSIVWLPTLHRLAASEAVKHKAKCSICKEYPIVGFRFRCLKCFNYDLCQSCFWSGRISHEHRLTHPVHQYCLSTTSGEDVKDFLSMVRNKFKARKYKKNPPKKLGYLPIQTVMEGGNLEAPPSMTPQQNVNNEVHNRLGMFANRLAEAESDGGKYSPKPMDEEHQLIAQYCQSLKSESTDAPRSPTQIVMSLDANEKDDLESEIGKLEDENRALQSEYERLKSMRDADHSSDGDLSTGSQSRDTELLTEAKLLRQHKGRLEARMQVLEDHNRQLEAQLQRLRQLLDQPSQDNRGAPNPYTHGSTPTSSISSMGDPPYMSGRSPRPNRSRGPDSDSESESNPSPVVPEPPRNGLPHETRKTKDSVSDLFSTAQDVNKAVEDLVHVMTDDNET